MKEWDNMNNKWRILLASLTASVMLAACGTSEPEVEPEGTTGNAVEEPADVETDVAEDTSAETEVEVDTEVDADMETDEGALTDAVETKSDEQDYSIMVIPGYNLVSEEPGRDSLLLDENNEVFMRIETVVKNDESYTFDEYYENMQELLMASSDGGTPAEITDDADLPETTGTAVKGSEVESTEGYFRGYVMDLEEKLVRVTIYSTEDDEHIEDFKEMAATIK